MSLTASPGSASGMWSLCLCGLVNDTTPFCAATDYASHIGSVTFSVGQGPGAIRSFTFTIIDDLEVESVETFLVEGDVSTASFPARFSNNQNSDTVSVNIEDNDGELSRTCLLSSTHSPWHC